MRWVLSVVLLGTAALSTAAAPRKASHLAKATRTTGRSSNKPAARFAGRGRARGRSRGAVRAFRAAPPPPSYQLHPDPERYQQIQQALAERGYFKGEANGTWGDDSTDALRRFQTDQKLPDDGKLSALSLTALGLGPRHDGSTASTVPVQPPALPDSPSDVPEPHSANPPQ